MSCQLLLCVCEEKRRKTGQNKTNAAKCSRLVPLGDDAASSEVGPLDAEAAVLQ